MKDVELTQIMMPIHPKPSKIIKERHRIFWADKLVVEMIKIYQKEFNFKVLIIERIFSRWID